jgi:hypothetical protein
VQAPKRKVSPGNNIFLIVSLAACGATIVVAGGVFAYGQFLAHVETAKAAELQQAQDAVNNTTIKDYIRLKDRFASGETLLDNHILLSQFFDELEKVTLQSVQFNSLNLTVAGDGTAKIDLSGTAKNFNALAVQSNTIAADQNFKEAIFSGIGFDSGNQIKFKLTANIDPQLIHMTKKQSLTLPATPITQPVVTAPVQTATTTKAATTTL